MIHIDKKYLFWTMFLFAIEIVIAVYVNDNFIRPYVGDFLVVILIYCFLKSFIKIHYISAAWMVLIFSYTIETLQYFDIVTILGLQESKMANIIIGNSFSWYDMIAYSLGILCVVLIEYIFSKK